MLLIRRYVLLMLFVLPGLTAISSVDSLQLETSGNSICYDSCMGNAMVRIFSSSGGPYQVIWKGNNLPGGMQSNVTSALTDTVFNLCAGNYSVEIVDQSDGSKTFPIYFTILQANPLSIVFQANTPTCHDSVNGNIDITLVQNGTGPFHYQWSTGPNDTLSSLSGLGRGVYGITITDDNNCLFEDSISLLTPDTLKANISGSHVTCKNECDGEVSIQPTGGTMPYSILWSNSDTNLTVSDLCPGNFIVTITDDLGCQVEDSFLVTEPDSLLASHLITDPNCHNSCDGEVTSVGSGGSRPYSYMWSGSSVTDSTLTGLCGGLLTTTITDANGCYFTTNINVTSPQALNIQPTVNASSCGLCDGDINVAASGGSAPYHYLWIGQKAQDTFPSIDSLCAGIYRLAVTDDNLCSDTFDVVLNDDTAGIKDITFLNSQASCQTTCDGSLMATAFSGTYPYSYSWSPGGQSDSVITGICAGTYTLEVTDGNGCKRIEMVELKAKSNVTATYESIFNNCRGDCQGEIQLNISDGIGPYQVRWTDSTSTSSVAGNLCSGTYPFQVTDANGCLFADTAEITDADSLVLSISSTDVSCFGSCDGSASIAVSGGKAPYAISWSNGQQGASASRLCAGTYTVEVEDANACVKQTTVIISGPQEINANLVVFDADCGVQNGSAKVSPTGGIPPYTFSWSIPNHPLFTGDSISRLSASISSPLSVFITDSNGCTQTDSFVIGESGGPDFTFNVNEISCPGACDASIEIDPPNAMGPVEYLWIPPFPSSTSTRIKGSLCPGTYWVGVKTQGCSTFEKVTIKDPDQITVTAQINGPSCVNSCDASVILQVSGGLPPYNYSWSNASTLDALSGICAGEYTVQVTDAEGCSVSKTIEVEDAEELRVELSTSNLSCYNQCNASIASMVTGGTAPFTYVWSDGSTGSSAKNLCAGNYWVTVYDANACSASDSISIGNGIPIAPTFIAVNADCGDCNGSLSVSANGGNGQPYSYLWSTGDTTAMITDLTAGIYTVAISDFSGCTQNFTAYVNNNGGPVLSDTTYPIQCYNSCNGAARAFATGGTSPYFFQWNDGLKQTGDSASSLCEGIYYYSAQDSFGCLSFDSVVIRESEEIKISSVIGPISCPGDSTGSIFLSVAGGTGNYTYLWSTADTTASIDSLPQGIYFVVVTDSLSCQKMDTFELNDPTPLSLSFGVTDTKCFNSCEGRIMANASGGSAPYTYSWQDGNSQTSNPAIGLCAGYTSLVVTDAMGCQATDSALVNAPSGINATPTLSNPTCANGQDGSIDLTISGGTGPYQVLWSNGMSGSSIMDLSAGTYTVSIVDSNQCVFSDSYVLTNPTGLSININTTNPGCGNNNGSASAVVSGGSGSYSFVWNSIPAQNNSMASNLWAGTYEVTVTDNNTGCTGTKEIILNNAGTTPLSFTVFDETCLGTCDGEARVIPGTGNFIFLWNDPAMSQDSIASSLCNGLYQVRVEDTSTSCIRFDTVRISSGDFRVRLVESKNVNCFGDCNGSITIEALGGTPPYEYDWNTVPVQNMATATNLCAGFYFGTASDSAGCSETVYVPITQADSMWLDVDLIREISCMGSCDAAAEALIYGGTGPYTIFWNGISGSALKTGLCSGQNTLEVVDANGCSSMINFNLAEGSDISDNAIVIKPSCGSFDGSIRLNPSGGTGPYTYVWSHGIYTNVANDLFAGIYTVEITDFNGCSKSFTYFLNNPNAPLLNFDQNTVKCNGDCNGVARVTPLGGVGPYSYIWDHVPVSSLDSLTDLCKGVYFVKVTDATGCVAFGADTIREPEVLEGLVTKITDGCGGLCEGEASIVGIGGTMPYDFTWNSNPIQNGSTATALCEDTIHVLLTDANGCEYYDSVIISPPPALVIDSTTFINASCFTNADGEASVYYNGGTSPHRFLWSNGQNTQSASGLNNGQISITITDTNGCTALDTVNIGVKDTVLVSSFVDSVVCIGNQTLLVATGYGATLFNWFTDSSGSLKNIGSGDSLYYTLEDTVTIYLRGQNNSTPPCFDLDTNYIIGIPPPVITASASKNPIEEGESTELLASPFLFNGMYAWDPSETLNDSASISPLAFPEETTTYVVIGRDEFGCQGTDTITIVVVEDESIINGFSPNGDGVNDVWVIPSLEDYPKVIVEVYNRWGIQVFRSEGYKDPWDGTYKGELLPNASYYFVIDYFGDGEKVESGAVTILY